ncbi:MAG TPA: HAD family hydrolase [Polyangia bacterium]|jgi:phosphoglycolate phosphatase-like HAD superfamily hydrolase
MLHLFDIDGTLVRSGGAGLRALERAFADRFGLAGATDGVHPDGKTDPLIVGEMFAARLGRPPTAAETTALLADYEVHLAAEVAAGSAFRALPGVHDLLERLAARREPVGLCTGNTVGGARLKLERLGLWRYFAFGGYGSDHAERSDVVRTAIARGAAHVGRAVLPAEVLVIGDTPRDIAAARAAGARAAAVATGPHPRAALATHAPDLLFDDLTQMIAWVDGPRLMAG